MNIFQYKQIESDAYGTQKEFHTNAFIAINDAEWYNAPNVFDDMEYEPLGDYGKKQFVTTTVRVDTVIDPSTGKSEGDDYKLFVFKPDAPKVFIGQLYKWKDSYWLCTNANTYEKIANGALVRRCNNVLKWIDKYGKLQIEPCVMSYDMQQANEYPGKLLEMTGGFTRIQFQKNIYSDYIYPNQRFLFGTPNNWKVLKITSGGLRNYMNSKTEDNYSNSIIEIWAAADYLNEATDDIINGVADAFAKQYTLNIEQANISQIVGFTTSLNVDIKKNNEPVYMPVVWNSSDESIVSVDNSGTIICLDIGAAVITASMENNPDIKDTITIDVVSSTINNFEIILNPDVNYILQGSKEIFECYLFDNGVVQTDVFTFVNDTSLNVPSDNYEFIVIDGNHFSIKNKLKYLSQPILITCISGTEQKTFQFTLKGAW